MENRCEQNPTNGRKALWVWVWSVGGESGYGASQARVSSSTMCVTTANARDSALATHRLMLTYVETEHRPTDDPPAQNIAKTEGFFFNCLLCGVFVVGHGNTHGGVVVCAFHVVVRGWLVADLISVGDAKK